MQFGITQETKSSNNIPFDAPYKDKETGKWKFPYGFLTAVVAEAEKETKKGKKTALTFTFKDDKGHVFNHIEWGFEPTDEKAEKKIEAMNTRIKHIYTQFAEFPTAGIGAKAKSFHDFFKAVAEAFTGKGEDAKPIYKNADNKNIPIWIKVIYGQGNNVQFPYAPNFLEKVIPNQDCKLTVNLQYDVVEQKAATGGMAFAKPGSIMGAPADLDSAMANMPDFND